MSPSLTWQDVPGNGLGVSHSIALKQWINSTTNPGKGHRRGWINGLGTGVKLCSLSATTALNSNAGIFYLFFFFSLFFTLFFPYLFSSFQGFLVLQSQLGMGLEHLTPRGIHPAALGRAFPPSPIPVAHSSPRGCDLWRRHLPRELWDHEGWGNKKPLLLLAAVKGLQGTGGNWLGRDFLSLSPLPGLRHRSPSPASPPQKPPRFPRDLFLKDLPKWNES